MGEKAHLRRIQQPVALWNAWRHNNPDLKPDLSGENLRRAGWRRIVFRKGLGKWASLDRADLSEANLTQADLSGAELSGADFSEADLSGADLSGADLTRANLESAILAWTNLTGATLAGANLQFAWLEGTVFFDVDLSRVLALDSCSHHGPSPIDHATLRKSGRLPLSFLRGCGLSDGVIRRYLPAIRKTQRYESCFISHSSKDSAFAKRLHTNLQNSGVRCWFAPEDLKVGARTRDEIDRSIARYDKLLLILSRHSIRSAWVEFEAEAALEREQREGQAILFPVRLDDAVMRLDRGWTAAIRRTRNIADFRNWKDDGPYRASLRRLLRDLRASPRRR